MKIAWTMGDGGRQLSLEFIPTTTTIGYGLFPGESEYQPAVMVCYSPEQLKEMAPVWQEMHERTLVPQVHIWNRTRKKPGPEVRVDFILPDVGYGWLQHFTDLKMLQLLEGEDIYTLKATLCAASAGNGDRDSTAKFFRVFEQTKSARVVVCKENWLTRWADLHTIKEFAADFTVTEIEKIPPIPFGL